VLALHFAGSEDARAQVNENSCTCSGAKQKPHRERDGSLFLTTCETCGRFVTVDRSGDDPRSWTGGGRDS
jgi:hypothetical protein